MRFRKILVEPRETMRQILDQPRDRAALGIFLLACVIGSIGDTRFPDVKAVTGYYGMVRVVAVSIGGLVVGLLAMTVLFYLFGWVATAIGRIFEGTGTAREVRSAIGWGTVPVIWSIVYRLPAAFLLGTRPAPMGGRGHELVIDTGRFANGCGWAVATVFVEVVVVLAMAWVSSNTIAEAHRFSTARGFATYLLSILSPLVIMLAAILTMVF